jgi:hypothetical protein
MLSAADAIWLLVGMTLIGASYILWQNKDIFSYDK